MASLRGPDVPLSSRPVSTILRLRFARVAFIMLCLALGLPGTRSALAASRPIRVSPDAITEKDLGRFYLTINLRQMPEAYRRVGEHSPTWDEPAVAFLEDLALWWAKPTSVSVGLDGLVAQGAALQNLGCTDPMVLYAYGSVLRKAGRVREAEALLRRSLDGLLMRGYPRIRAAMAVANLALIYRSLRGDDDPDFEKYFQLHLQHLNESLADGSHLPGELRGLVETLHGYSQDLYQGRLSEVYESLKSNPKADPYLVGYAGGLHQIEAAWEARGGGWAYEVTDEGWEGFYSHMEAARTLLADTWRANPSLPHAPTQMITVEAAAGDDTEVRVWFDRAITAQADYILAYDSLLWFMRPRWGGDLDEMYAFGLECLKTGRFDTDVPLMYARVLSDITDELDSDTEYWRRPGVYERLEAMFDGYARAQPERSAWFRSIHAATAYRCGKEDQAKGLLAALGSDLDEGLFAHYAGVSASTARDKLGATQTQPAAAESRRILCEFTPGTPEEETQIFLDRGTSPVPEYSARVAYIGQKMIYSFAIPPDVDGADLIIDAWNAVVVAVARDAGDGPGEFHEEVNVLTLFGRVDRGQGWSRQHYALDLTPYLEDNPSRTVYVAIYSADQTTGWAGSAWSHIVVVALDEDERARLARRQRTVNEAVKEVRARCLLHVRTNRGEGDAAYLYQERGSDLQPSSRVLEGEAEVVYRLPLESEYEGAELFAWVLGDSLVSYATDEAGRPGPFTDVFRARDEFGEHAIETHTNPGRAKIAITGAMVDSGAIYLRIRDGAPDKPGEVQIHALTVERP